MANQQSTTQTNTQYSLNYRDALRGVLIAVITAVLTAVLDMLNVGGLEGMNWKTIGVVGLTAGISYLVKNFFSASEIVVLNPTQQAMSAVKEGAPIEVAGETVAKKDV